MSLGSISSTSAATALEAARLDATRISGDRRAQTATASASAAAIASAVAAADAREPIRSLSTTQGTLLDTYM